MVTVAVRSPKVVLALQRTVTVTDPSAAFPDEGDTDTHESEQDTVQSRFAVKVMEPLLPSADNSIFPGLVIVNSGAFWHALSSRKTEQSSIQRYLRVISVVIIVEAAPRPPFYKKVWSIFRLSELRLWTGPNANKQYPTPV